MSNTSEWYKVAMSYVQSSEDGKQKVVIDEILFQAVNYSDAENRGANYMPANYGAHVHKVVKMPLNEVFNVNLNDPKYYKVKVHYLTYSEKTKQEKRTPAMYLVDGNSVDFAAAAVRDKLGKLEDYEVVNVSLTKILEVVPLKD